MRGGLGCGRRFELLGGVSGGVPLYIAGIFVEGFVKQRILPTSSSRYSLSVELKRNLMFAASSSVIVKSKSFSIESLRGGL